MSMLGEFKKFALRGNIVDLAIGFTVGAAFSTVAKSLVNDIIMPPIGLILGNMDFSDLFILLKKGRDDLPPYATLGEAQQAGAVTLNYGQFINSLLTLTIVALAMFLLIRTFNRLHDRLEDEFGASESNETADQEPSDKKCQYCRSVIPFKATRCPQCTSQLAGVTEAAPGAPGPAKG